MKKVVFDPSLNPISYHTIPNGDKTANYTYDQIDIYDKMFGIIYEVLYHQNENPAANMKNFAQLEYLLAPFEHLTTLWIDNI